MSHIVIAIPNEVPRKYPLPDTFTYREQQTIKIHTGLRPIEYEDALNSGDPDIVIALAVICAARAGHNITYDQLLDLEIGAITAEGDDADPTPAASVDDAVEAATIHADGGTLALPVSTD